MIVEQTNLYYTQVNTVKHSSMAWIDTFWRNARILGVTFAMDVVRMGCREDGGVPSPLVLLYVNL